jgi:hypothetical protein
MHWPIWMYVVLGITLGALSSLLLVVFCRGARRTSVRTACQVVLPLSLTIGGLCSMTEANLRAAAASTPADLFSQQARQGKCCVCTRYMHKWDTHASCINCSVSAGYMCAPDRPCGRCKDWDQTTWTIYLLKIKEAQAAKKPARRALNLQGSPTAPASLTSLPTGPFSPGPGYPWAAAMAGPWGPWRPPTPQQQADFYREQLALLQMHQPSAPADTDIPCGQKSRSVSPR